MRHRSSIHVTYVDKPDAPRADQPAEVVDYDLLAYDRYVEAPRRAGRDPVWDSMWAEALSGQHGEQDVA